MKTRIAYLVYPALLSIVLTSCDYVKNSFVQEDQDDNVETVELPKKISPAVQEEEAQEIEDVVDDIDYAALSRSLDITMQIKENIVWENFSVTGNEDLSALYFVGWYHNLYAAFIASQESSECGGLSSKLFIQNMITDSIIYTYDLSVDCDHGHWMQGYRDLNDLLEINDIQLSNNLSINKNESGVYSDLAFNENREAFRIDINIDSTSYGRFESRKQYTAVATAPNGMQKIIGRGSKPIYKNYRYAGYIQSPDMSRIAIVLRASEDVGDGYFLSKPIIIGCKLDVSSF